MLPKKSNPSWNKPFINLVLQINSSISITKLHSLIKDIENQLGRESNHQKWSPRSIDIDILTAQDQTIQNKQLTVPHPRLLERDFVLAPFRDIASDFIVHQQPVLSHYRKLNQKLVTWMDVFNFTPDSFSDGGQLTNNSTVSIQNKIQKKYRSLCRVVRYWWILYETRGCFYFTRGGME